MNVLVKRLFSVIGPNGVGYVVAPRMGPIKVRESDDTFILDLPRGALALSGDRMMQHIMNGDLEQVSS